MMFSNGKSSAISKFNATNPIWITLQMKNQISAIRSQLVTSWTLAWTPVQQFQTQDNIQNYDKTEGKGIPNLRTQMWNLIIY
jgi:hypothetical protein